MTFRCDYIFIFSNTLQHSMWSCLYENFRYLTSHFSVVILTNKHFKNERKCRLLRYHKFSIFQIKNHFPMKFRFFGCKTAKKLQHKKKYEIGLSCYGICCDAELLSISVLALLPHSPPSSRFRTQCLCENVAKQTRKQLYFKAYFMKINNTKHHRHHITQSLCYDLALCCGGCNKQQNK